ncbi:hypothetical protein HBI56_088340 [Parastagonospora nodorum]|nr:hypothetical protein HBH51_091420 [Parastagonospora nodorum]KAH3999728.1 hypothetical protein HBI10_114100 [Parastagonospora nodorum]KAH4013127.1 hypothetical protein HBI13_180150 [Parastagonospora nodorum]KAH4035195.1 hypothetical protein HBI09_096550 [Parastagonospora nodorum]KAH4048804.1 hypothetical protein HBH49_151450 [Parastagonospora nodorum]
MASSISGPGILFVRSRISSPLLSEPTFLHWYDDDHIPEVVATSGIKSGFRYVDVNKTSPNGNEDNKTPFLACYPMKKLEFMLGEEFKGINVTSEILPGNGVIYDLADMDVRFLGLVGKMGEKEEQGPAKFILTCGVRLGASQSVDGLFERQHEELRKAQGYLRTLSFDLRFARSNAESKKLKGLPAGDEPSTEPSTHLAIHEFEERPDEQLVEIVRKSVSELGDVQPEVLVFELHRVHGEREFFD